jgi:hypothetical protein
VITVEEDGEEIFTPIPKMCSGWPLPHEPAPVREMMGFMRCEYCKASFGPAQTVKCKP